MSSAGPPQRIGDLTPWREALAVIASLTRPSPARRVAPVDAIGAVAADDVYAPAPLPAAPQAIRDGWAVRAELVADAGPYAPTPLVPAPRWVDAGEEIPEGCDAVLPPDGIVATGGIFEAVASAGPGEGVAAAGFDATPATPVLRAGMRIGATAASALRIAGIDAVPIRRPRVGVVDGEGDSVAAMVRTALLAAGAEPIALRPGDDMAQRADTAALDALITVGGTGQGRADRTVSMIRSAGRVKFHGIGIRPGETAGVGSFAERPVLLLPGRLDAALGAWLLLGLPMLRCLAGGIGEPVTSARPLSRKLTSGIGIAEVILVESDGAAVRPLAAGTFPLAAVTQAAGWVLVPPESEGYPSGVTVSVNPLP